LKASLISPVLVLPRLVLVAVELIGVLDLGDLAWPEGDLAAEISALLEELDEFDDEEQAPGFVLFLSIASRGFTADESAPIWEQVCASRARGLFLASICGE